MAAWNNATVVEHHHWSDSLHTLYLQAEIEPYQAGQFVKIGLEIDGKIIGKPYSLVNAPGTGPLEIYYIDVPEGEFSPHLQHLGKGDSLYITPRASGFMVLDEVPASAHLWLMATGTGIGPFLAMLSDAQIWQRYQKVVLVYAVRKQEELSYQQRIADALAQHGDQLVYIPFVSRETTSFALSGRIPEAISDGRLEQAAGLAIDAADTQVVLCGNPHMLEDTMACLAERGLKKHRRRDPGQITTESYWTL